jgi:RimJ/RimL family protein N-acetyltransferase
MIIFNDAHFGGAIADASGTTFNPLCDVCIARVRGGELLGGMIYTNFTGHSIGVHIAGFEDGWINQDLLWVGFDYPFRQLGVKKIFGLVPESNSKALAFDMKLGFKIVSTIPDVFTDGGMVVLAMSAEDCRFLKMRPRILTQVAHAA